MKSIVEDNYLIIPVVTDFREYLSFPRKSWYWTFQQWIIFRGVVKPQQFLDFYIFDVLTAIWRLANRFSTVSSGNRQMLLKKFKAFVCIWLSMGNNPVRIYSTGSAVWVGSDKSCFRSLFKNASSLSLCFFSIKWFQVHRLIPVTHIVLKDGHT